MAPKRKRRLQRTSHEVTSSSASPACLNPAVAEDAFEDVGMKSNSLKLVSAYVLQRHTDRWLYRHDTISDLCWPGQENSSSASSRLADDECLLPGDEFGYQELVTVWETWPRTSDPYAAPARGSCQLPAGKPQATRQGLHHVKRWGDLLWWQYVGYGMLEERCPVGQVALHADSAQKNELTLQSAFEVLCDRPATLAEFPKESTLVNSSAEPTLLTPWYLVQGQCRGPRLTELLAEAEAARLNSTWWTRDVEELAARTANITGHEPPPPDQAARFLSAVVDCTVVHSCTGLRDVPSQLLSKQTGLPSQEGLFGLIDRAETADLNWPLNYWRSKGDKAFVEFSSLYFGYFFAVLADQLKAAANGVPGAPRLTISVMSDINIVPLLTMYGLHKAASVRPPYLAALVHELYQDASGHYHIRVLYDGKTQRVCKGASDYPLCPLSQWEEEVVKRYTPSKSACPVLYNSYDCIADRGYAGGLLAEWLPWLQHWEEHTTVAGFSFLAGLWVGLLLLWCCCFRPSSLFRLFFRGRSLSTNSSRDRSYSTDSSSQWLLRSC
ncbi:unnamed protein product [Polarella glacialis]|uniref:Uncharacterized protein n=1 Tax=Polarella glacialis TaxID=89957 RepID=A0A813KQN9_POLGL|nr:unnamed protein product [Polarella glacialis]